MEDLEFGELFLLNRKIQSFIYRLENTNLEPAFNKFPTTVKLNS